MESENIVGKVANCFHNKILYNQYQQPLQRYKSKLG